MITCRATALSPRRHRFGFGQEQRIPRPPRQEFHLVRALAPVRLEMHRQATIASPGNCRRVRGSGVGPEPPRPGAKTAAGSIRSLSMLVLSGGGESQTVAHGQCSGLSHRVCQHGG